MVHSITILISSIIIVFSPIYLLFLVGPKVREHRIVYFFIGLGTAAIAGGILFLVALDQRFPDPTSPIADISRRAFAGLIEELLRYPGILIAQQLGLKWINHFKGTDKAEEIFHQIKKEKHSLVQGDFTNIRDPHGMGMYFGVGYGIMETFVFYIYPAVVSHIRGFGLYSTGDHVIAIFFRITAVLAHVALTYMAMAITVEKSFWRLTILTHILSNVLNRSFAYLSPAFATRLVIAVFSRVAIYLIAIYFLRPRTRYLSPGVLILMLVVAFLAIIAIISFIVFLFEFLFSEIPLPVLPT